MKSPPKHDCVLLFERLEPRQPRTCRKPLRPLFWLVVAIGLWPVQISQSWAQAVVTDFGTGRAGNTLIEYGSPDDQWMLISAPQGVTLGPARVISPHPDYFDPQPGSRWIAPPSATNGLTDFPNGDYAYRTSFSLPARAVYTVRGSYGSDDESISLSFNETILDTFGGGFLSPSYPSTFESSDQSTFKKGGTNTVVAHVHNKVHPAGATPTALALQGLVTLHPNAQTGASILFREGANGSFGNIRFTVDHAAFHSNGLVYEAHPGYPAGYYWDDKLPAYQTVPKQSSIQQVHTYGSFKYNGAWQLPPMPGQSHHNMRVLRPLAD